MFESMASEFAAVDTKHGKMLMIIEVGIPTLAGMFGYDNEEEKLS